MDCNSAPTGWIFPKLQTGGFQSWVDSGWDGLGSVEGVHHVLELQGVEGDDVLGQGGVEGCGHWAEFG